MDDVREDLMKRLKQRVEGVDGVVKGSTELRTHFVGPRPYVEVTLGTPRGGSLESAHQLSEVVETAKEIHIDLDLEVADHLSLAEAHKRSEELEEALRRELTGRVQIAVHLEPRSDDARPAVRRLSSAHRSLAAL
jgi:divalent metal cation (Fe/Co/Zn/Cd) transporter